MEVLIKLQNDLCYTVIPMDFVNLIGYSSIIEEEPTIDKVAPYTSSTSILPSIEKVKKRFLTFRTPFEFNTISSELC